MKTEVRVVASQVYRISDQTNWKPHVDKGFSDSSVQQWGLMARVCAHKQKSISSFYSADSFVNQVVGSGFYLIFDFLFC